MNITLTDAFAALIADTLNQQNQPDASSQPELSAFPCGLAPSDFEPFIDCTRPDAFGSLFGGNALVDIEALGDMWGAGTVDAGGLDFLGCGGIAGEDTAVGSAMGTGLTRENDILLNGPLKRATSTPEATEPDSVGVKRRRMTTGACATCQKSHLSCDGARPCARCVRRGEPNRCVDPPRKVRVKAVGTSCNGCPVVAQHQQRPLLPMPASRAERPHNLPPCLAARGLLESKKTASSPAVLSPAPPSSTFPTPSTLAPSTASTPRDLLFPNVNPLDISLSDSFPSLVSTTTSDSEQPFPCGLLPSEFLPLVEGCQPDVLKELLGGCDALADIEALGEGWGVGCGDGDEWIG
ncbi:hypothetical protein HK101_009179 [Irineochytrium annulatum]|nr:hypothetical protein HK101_009179 [Irineochytrium annulatum]